MTIDHRQPVSSSFFDAADVVDAANVVNFNQDLRKIEEVPLFTGTNIPYCHGLGAVRNRTYQGDCVSPINVVNVVISSLSRLLTSSIPSTP